MSLFPWVTWRIRTAPPCSLCGLALTRHVLHQILHRKNLPIQWSVVIQEVYFKIPEGNPLNSQYEWIWKLLPRGNHCDHSFYHESLRSLKQLAFIKQEYNSKIEELMNNLKLDEINYKLWAFGNYHEQKFLLEASERRKTQGSTKKYGYWIN